MALDYENTVFYSGLRIEKLWNIGLSWFCKCDNEILCTCAVEENIAAQTMPSVATGEAHMLKYFPPLPSVTF